MVFKEIENRDLSKRPLKTYTKQKSQIQSFTGFENKKEQSMTPLVITPKQYYSEIFNSYNQHEFFSSPMKSYPLICKTHYPASRVLKKVSLNSKKKPFTTKEKFTQLCLDLLPSRTTCPDCGMSYIRGSSDDEYIHIKFHAGSIGGIDYPLTNSIKEVWAESFNSNRIIMISMSSPSREVKKAEEILKVVDLELGSASPFPSLTILHDSLAKQYKFFLYLKGKKCVGLVLVEHIQSAYPIHPSSSQSSSITLKSEALSTCIMGVSRIWVCKTYRREKIATRLLDVACNHFIYGITVKKHEVAFSQPSESGKLFIESWAGKNFNVYMEK
ncbi:hypothetical protein PCANB_002836 [Pneumocystis canis]|nr:hypothetical protein PCANB_002836 [Pneumocystis canis]